MEEIESERKKWLLVSRDTEVLLIFPEELQPASPALAEHVTACFSDLFQCHGESGYSCERQGCSNLRSPGIRYVQARAGRDGGDGELAGGHLWT